MFDSKRGKLPRNERIAAATGRDRDKPIRNLVFPVGVTLDLVPHHSADMFRQITACLTIRFADHADLNSVILAKRALNL